MFYRIMYLIVTLVFSHLGFWSGNLFLIASFPDLCLLVPSNTFHRQSFILHAVSLTHHFYPVFCYIEIVILENEADQSVFMSLVLHVL